MPRHVLRVFSDDEGQEKVEIQVHLPGGYELQLLTYAGAAGLVLMCF